MPKIYLCAEALAKNYRLLKGKTQGQLIPVVKADAYGHGAPFVLRTLLNEGASMFAVAAASEARELLDSIEKSELSFTKARILVMGPVEKETLPSLFSPSVILSLHSPEYAREVSCAIEQCKASLLLPARFSLSVHLKLETGMHRLGIRTERGIREILSLPHLRIEGCYSHLAHAANEERVTAQKNRFLSLLPLFPANLLTHLSASEGLLRYGDLSLPAARAGLSLYGVAPEGISLPLLPVMRFSARVLSVFRVKQGEYVGYGSLKTEKARRLAVIDAGYADGIPPSAEEGGRIQVMGRACPFFGAVCMDRATLDIGDLPLKPGDEITLFGQKAGDTLAFAQSAGVSPYVLLSLRSKRTDRIYI